MNGETDAASIRSEQVPAPATRSVPAARREGAIAIGAAAVGALALGALAVGSRGDRQDGDRATLTRAGMAALASGG